MCTIMVYTGEDMSEQTFAAALAKTETRGPDMTRIMRVGGGLMGFQRLSIMGLSEAGMQPFFLDGSAVVCNGELYGFRPVKKQLEKKYAFGSDSDCEIILPLYKEYGTDMFAKLDAEFAMVIYDAEKKDFVAARDPIGIRPLFYGYTASGKPRFVGGRSVRVSAVVLLCGRKVRAVYRRYGGRRIFGRRRRNRRAEDT